MGIYGSFVEPEYNDSSDSEFLTLRFQPNSTFLQNRWRTNGLSADFLADYLGVFFPGEDSEALNRRAEIKGGVSFIANELLENAMKFTNSSSEGSGSIDLTMELKEESIIFYVSNYLSTAHGEKFKAFIHKLLTEDPDDLFMEQMLSNDEEGSTSSGLGYLTSMTDWKAILGWKFEMPEGKVDAEKVTVMVTYPII